MFFHLLVTPLSWLWLSVLNIYSMDGSYRSQVHFYVSLGPIHSRQWWWNLRNNYFHLSALAKPWSGLAIAMAMAITMYIIIPSKKSEAHFHVMDCQETAVRWVVNLKGKFGKFYLLAPLDYNLWLWLSVHIHPKDEKSGSLHRTSELQSI